MGKSRIQVNQQHSAWKPVIEIDSRLQRGGALIVAIERDGIRLWLFRRFPNESIDSRGFRDQSGVEAAKRDHLAKIFKSFDHPAAPHGFEQQPLYLLAALAAWVIVSRGFLRAEQFALGMDDARFAQV